MTSGLFRKGRTLYERHRDVVSYLFWGVVTTLVNYAAYFACRLWCGIDYIASNVIAWAVAVVFAFVVNKVYVFRSLDWSPRVAFRECWEFVAARLFSGVLETGILKVFVDWLGMSDAIVKIFSNIVVVIANYIFSKFVIFRKKKVLLEKLDQANVALSSGRQGGQDATPETGAAGAEDGKAPADQKRRRERKRRKASAAPVQAKPASRSRAGGKGKAGRRKARRKGRR